MNMRHFFSEVKSFISAWADRPLIWLLPIYMWGICEGWGGEGGDFARPLTLSALLAGATFALSFASGIFHKYAVLLLIPCAFWLGEGLASRAVTAPNGPSHLIHFTTEERFPRHIILGGVVKESFQQPESRYQRLIIDAREILQAGSGGPLNSAAVKGLARIDVTGGARVAPGDYVRLPVILRRLTGFKNPGATNPEKFWGAHGVWVNGYVRDPALISSWPRFSPPPLLQPLRDKAVEFLYSRAPHPARGILASLLLGRRGDVDSESETIFRNLGLSHILSVSGLHLGLWYGLCLWLCLRALRRLWPRRAFSGGGLTLAAPLLALGPALFYAALVGGASPVIRAAIMVTGAALALLVKRGADTWNIMALAAWLILLAAPERLFTASFQMSFVATAALVAAFRPRPALGAGERRAQKSFLHKALLASLAGTFGTAPLVLWHFSRLPLAGLLGNVIFGPLISVCALIPGLLSLMILPVCEPLAAILMNCAATALMFMLPVMEGAASAAGPGLILPFLGLGFVAAYCAAAWLLLRSPWPVKKRLAVSAAILIIGALPYAIHGQGTKDVLRFTVLDVGQGEAVHINFPDRRQMIIDGGGSRYFDPGERLITPYLLRQGIHKIHYLALTHPDEDHVKGLISLARNFHPDEIWSNPWPGGTSPLYEELREAARNIPRPTARELWNGWRIGSVTVESLWPEPQYEWPDTAPKGDWANNMGQVFKITWGDISFLVTGDIEKKTERALVQLHGQRLLSTVLIAPHHGSQSAMSPEFIRAVKPLHIVFSAGRHNYFGHPSPKSLEIAAQSGAAIHRTDQTGAVIFEVREQNGEVLLLP